MEVFVQVLKVVCANTLSDDSRTGTGSSHWQTCSLIPAAFMVSSFPELGGPICCSCQQINIYISCSPIQRVQKPKEKTTIIDLRGCQHCCSFLYAYKINVMLDVTITTYESQFHSFPLVFEHFRL